MLFIRNFILAIGKLRPPHLLAMLWMAGLVWMALEGVETTYFIPFLMLGFVLLIIAFMADE